jgi:hypothetical protein
VRKTVLSAAIIVAASLATPSIVSAAALAEGSYDCSVAVGMGIMAMGHMDIRGNTYRFRPYDKVTDGFSSYTMAANGALQWSGPMGGLKETPSVLTESLKTDYGFYVKYRTKPGGWIDTMSCRHMEK